MTLTDDLRQADKDFDRPAIPGIFAEYIAYMATGKYPYIESVAEFICSRHDLPDDLTVNGNGRRDCGTKLSHEVYLASGQYRLLKMVEQERDLANLGFLPITELQPAAGQKVRLSDGTVYRLVPARGSVQRDDGAWVSGDDFTMLEPRKRTHGISLNKLVSHHKAFLRAKERNQTAMDGPRVVMFAFA